MFRVWTESNTFSRVPMNDFLIFSFTLNTPLHKLDTVLIEIPCTNFGTVICLSGSELEHYI